MLVDSWAEVNDLVQEENGWTRRKAESWLLDLLDEHNKANNKTNRHTAFICIQQMTKGGDFDITTFNDKTVGENAFNSIMGFFFMYILTFIFSTILLSFFNLDFLTSVSAAASAISNVGPGLGSIIGPTGNYASLPSETKWILSITMLIGRLELFTFLVLLSVSFWKK